MYIFLFSISTLFALQVDSMQHNFTYFSYTAPYQIPYLIWFMVIGISVYIKLYRIAKKVSIKTKILTHVTLIFYTLGGLLPYRPNTQNLFSTLHVFFCIVALLLFIYIIFKYIQSIVLTNSQLHRKLVVIFETGMLSFIPICFINGSINIIVELYCIGFLFYMLYTIENMEKDVL